MQKRWWYLLFLIPLLYRPILGLFLIFFFPGLGFVLNLFKKTNTYEKISLSIALSLCLVVLNGFFLNMTFGLNFISVFISLALISLIPLYIYFKKEKFDFKKLEIKKPSNRQIFQIILLILCLSFLAVKVYQPHFNNPYPIHLDEWSRLLETVHIIDQGTFNQRYNPQFVGHPDAPVRLNPGFQFILSQFYIISGVNQITFFQYLPALFAILTAFILFSFLNKISNYWTGLFAIIFLSFLKTNDNTLGISYLIALTMTFPLLYALFHSLFNAFEKKDSLYFLLASFIYFTVCVIHEQTGAAFLPIILLYLLVSSIIFIVKNRKIEFSLRGTIITIISLIIPFFSFYVARDLIWKGTLSKTIAFLLKLIVWQGITETSYPYNFILFYGPILLLLAIIGIIILYKNIDMNVFFIWSLIALGQVINFYYNHITYFSYIERIRHHAVLGLIPLSAYGLFSILDLSSKLIKNYKNIFLAAISIIIIIIASINSYNYIDNGNYLPEDKQPKNGLVLNPTIDYKDYQAILFLKTISYKQVVLADPQTSAAIYPISKNYIVASSENPDAGFGGGNMEAVKKFFSSSSCTEKQNIIYQNNVKYILSKKPINCPNLKQIYSSNLRYIYEVE
jgi:hypothetical protein